jgi:hypothetical protein
MVSDHEGVIMSTTMQVCWGRLRPGATVVGVPGGEQKVVAVEQRGPTVSVLFWDGTRESHREDAYAQVRVSTTEP